MHIVDIEEILNDDAKLTKIIKAIFTEVEKTDLERSTKPKFR